MISKRALGFLMTILAMFSLLAFVGIAAQELEEASEPTSTSNREEALQRVEQRKADRHLKLSDNRERVLINKCENAQTRLTSLAGRVEAAGQRRNMAYSSFSEKLHGFESRLNEASVDVTDLIGVLSAYDAMVSALELQFAEYVQAINDLTTLDCTTDPEGFQATLESARELVSQIKDEVKAVHDYLRGEVRQAFTTTMQSFNNSENGDGDSSTDATSEEL